MQWRSVLADRERKGGYYEFNKGVARDQARVFQ